jgi:hypothetical protein
MGLKLNGAHQEGGLELNVEKTKYMLLSRHQNADESRQIKIVTSFKNVSVQIFWKDSNNQNLIQEEIKRRLNFGNAVKKVMIRIYKTIILLVDLYECETLFLTLRD